MHAQVQAWLVEARQRVVGLSRYSVLFGASLEEALTRIIQEYGVEGCYFALKIAGQREDVLMFQIFLAAVFRVLGRLGLLSVGRRLMKDLMFSGHLRLFLYTEFARTASAKDKEEVVLAMRRLVDRDQTPFERFDARMMLYEVTREPHELEILKLDYRLRRAPAMIFIKSEDLDVLFLYAIHSAEVATMMETLSLLEVLPPIEIRDYGEHVMRSLLPRWSRTQLFALAQAASTTRYQPMIEEIARNTRSPEEIAELERD